MFRNKAGLSACSGDCAVVAAAACRLCKRIALFHFVRVFWLTTLFGPDHSARRFLSMRNSMNRPQYSIAKNSEHPNYGKVTDNNIPAIFLFLPAPGAAHQRFIPEQLCSITIAVFAFLNYA